METIAPLWLWIVFVVFVIAALFVDFVVLKKQGAHEVSIKEAVNWSLLWVGAELRLQRPVLVGGERRHRLLGHRQ